MAISSAELHPGLPAGQPVVEPAPARSLRAGLLALVKLAVVGGLAFAVGFLAMIAMRSVGLAAGLAAAIGGPMLLANVLERLYRLSGRA